MSFFQDLRFAIRGLRRAPGLVVVGTLSLGVGIAAVTTMWAATDTLIGRPLPYDPEAELVFVGTLEDGRGGASSPSAVPDFLDLRDAVTTARLAAYRDAGVSLGGDPPEWVRARRVSGDFFAVLGVAPRLGRLFGRADESPGQEEAAVLGYGLWQRRFGGDPGVIGRAISVDGLPATVVGVLPERFAFGHRSPELWLPLRVAGEEPRSARTVSVIGRMGRGPEALRSELATAARGLAESYPSTNAAREFRASGVLDEWFGGPEFRQGMTATLVAGLLVLLVACVNVANLLLARGTARSDEITVRRALGASRLRLIRQLLGEAVVLAALGGALGVLLSMYGLRGLVTLMPEGMARGEEVGMDVRVLALAAFVALGSALLAGLLPSLRTVRSAPGRVDGGRSDGLATGRHRLRGVLVGAEVALAMVLLATTALVVRSVTVVQAVDTGFRADGVVVFRVDLPAARYPDDDARREAARRIEAAVAAIPGATRAGAGVGVPARSWRSVSYRLPEEAEDGAQNVFARFASPGYLPALGVEPLRGRSLEPGDGAGAPAVALVNERLAAARWPGEDAIGRVLHIGDRAVEVIGVVPDVREFGPTFPAAPGVYLPLAQWPSSQVDLVVSGAAGTGALLAGARAAVARVDPDLAIHGETTLAAALMGPAEQYTSLATLLAVLAGAAILLAVAGVYGSMAYAVARRVPEIGLRMAVGADAGAVRRMVLGDAARVAGTGVAIGLVLALGAAQGIRGFLFGVRPADPLVLTAVPALLLGVSLAAAWLPARRASRVDPMAALRRE